MELFFHFINSSIKSFTLSNTSFFLAERASSIASNVSALGTQYMASIRIASTRLFRLRFSRLASVFRRSNKALSKRKAVDLRTFTASIKRYLFYIYKGIANASHLQENVTKKEEIHRWKSSLFKGVISGTRTHDIQNHNLTL